MSKLTKPQVLKRCQMGEPETIWPKSDRQVAGTLRRLGLITIENDTATITNKGIEAIFSVALAPYQKSRQ